MCLEADFLDAHKRHGSDAELLNRAERWANADHLYGMAAECGLKHLMIIFGMNVDRLGSPGDSDRKHADGIWKRFESYRSGHPLGTGYALPSENPFHDWHISDRYANQSKFSQSRMQSHRAGAQIVCELVKKSELDGLK